MSRFLLAISLALVPPGLCGCSWTDGGRTHTLVLGAGIVSAQRDAAGATASLERTRAVGVLALPGGLVLGTLDRSVLSVAPGTQLLADAALLRSGQNTLIVRPVAATCAATLRTTQEIHSCLDSSRPCCWQR